LAVTGAAAQDSLDPYVLLSKTKLMIGSRASIAGGEIVANEQLKGICFKANLKLSGKRVTT